jgi:hypothetical protein
MEVWIDPIDDQHEAYVTAVDKSELDIVAAHCGALKSSGQTKTPDGDWMVMSAHPWTIVHWCNINGVSFKQFMREPKLMDRFINDPDNAAFRVHGGRV